MAREPFTKALGFVFEDSPWVAEEAWSGRPFGSIEELHEAMTAIVGIAPRDKKLALLRAHPDLGSRARMSEASVGEQTGAGLTALTPEEFAELTRMNAAYRERFGFPFLYAVIGASKGAIMDALRERLRRSAEAEFAEALEQVYRIAGFRLENLLATDAHR